MSILAEKLDGRAVASQVLQEITARTQEIIAQQGKPPQLAAIQVGDDAASSWYVRQIARTCQRASIAFGLHLLDADSPTRTVVELVSTLGEDPSVQGIIVQQPLPPQLDRAAVIAALNPDKDVDGLHPINAGLLAQGATTALAPATPLGGIELLHRAGLPIEGKDAVIVGRSAVVGRPLAMLLLAEHATVTLCHTRTRSLSAHTQRADILAVAAGRPGLITAEMVKPGVVVLDFGINDVEGRMVGDVAAGVAAVAGYFTPVSGGTGPMTNAMLLYNLLRASERQIG